MRIFSGRNTCFQCQRAFSDSNTYCPHCGATRRENVGQLLVRRLRRVGLSLLLGVAVGVVAALLLGTLFPDWSTRMSSFPLLSGRYGIEMIGGILGGVVSATLYTLREYARE